MTRLSSEPEFVERFETTFGPGGLTLGNLLRALAQFQRTLVSADSRYDRWLQGEPGANLSPGATRTGARPAALRHMPRHGVLYRQRLPQQWARSRRGLWRRRSGVARRGARHPTPRGRGPSQAPPAQRGCHRAVHA
ncbi:cytochrome-c peroxidase [Myxococcus virescens]|nr:cytochrome-c peroxidase [Myxococcus virescens]